MDIPIPLCGRLQGTRLFLFEIHTYEYANVYTQVNTYSTEDSTEEECVAVSPTAVAAVLQIR